MTTNGKTTENDAATVASNIDKYIAALYMLYQRASWLIRMMRVLPPWHVTPCVLSVAMSIDDDTPVRQWWAEHRLRTHEPMRVVWRLALEGRTPIWWRDHLAGALEDDLANAANVRAVFDAVVSSQEVDGSVHFRVSRQVVRAAVEALGKRWFPSVYTPTGNTYLLSDYQREVCERFAKLRQTETDLPREIDVASVLTLLLVTEEYLSRY